MTTEIEKEKKGAVDNPEVVPPELIETENLGGSSDFLEIDDGDFGDLINELEGNADAVEFAINSDLDDLDKSPDVNGGIADEVTVKSISSNDKSKAPITGKMAAGGAKMYVATFDLVVSKTCAVIADEEDDSRFRLSTKDKEAYTQVSKEFFKTANIKLSPEFMFLAFSVFISIGSFWSAHKIKKEKKIRSNRLDRIRKRQAEKATRTKSRQMEMFAKEDEEEEIEEIDEELQADRNKMLDDVGRKKFDVDKANYYIHDKKGTRLKSGERYEKAPQQVISWKEEGLRNLQIYKKIQKMNYGNESE